MPMPSTNNGHVRKLEILYARVSTEEQAKSGYSLAQQIEALKEEFEEHGCKIRALNDHGDDSPEGELMDGVFDQFAKFERAKTAERSRRGKLRKDRLADLEDARATAERELET